MEKCAKCEVNEHCPFINDPTRDYRLCGLWNLVGNSTFEESGISSSGVTPSTLHDIFKNDPFSYDVLRAIVITNPMVTDISISQDFCYGDAQDTGEFVTLLRSDNNPIMVVDANSHLIVLVERDSDPNVVNVWVWDTRFMKN